MNHLKWAGALAGAFLVAGAAGAAEPLVSAEWLQDNLDNPDVRVFEVSVDTGVYERGHIPGAVHLDWHTELVDPTRRDIASREEFEAKLRDAGITGDTQIVLYGDNNNWFAAWGAWVFDVYGIEVSLLDGGRKLWEAQGLPLDTNVRDYADSDITLPERNGDLRARLTDVLDIAEGRLAAKLVDIRSNDEYTGKIFAPEGVKELAVRAGHIPTAENVPWGTIVQEDGTARGDQGDLCRQGHRRLAADRHLLPHRRAFVAHLVRAEAHPRLRCEELRRLMDRIRQRRRRSCRQRRRHGLDRQVGDWRAAFASPKIAGGECRGARLLSCSRKADRCPFLFPPRRFSSSSPPGPGCCKARAAVAISPSRCWPAPPSASCSSVAVSASCAIFATSSSGGSRVG